MDIDVSIIIPAYNTGKYLKKCLDSIYKLNMNTIEIIMIDDGSTDDTLDIMKKYKEKEKIETKIVTQKNQGLSASRNLGLTIAKGKYILFIDSDDFVDTENLKIFLKEGIEANVEILMGNSLSYYNKDYIIKDYYSKKLLDKGCQSGYFYIENRVKEKCWYMGVCRNLYKREFLLMNKLLFKEKLLYEDNLFSLITFSKAKRVKYSKEYFYYYRQIREGSITSKKTLKHIKHLFYIIDELIDYFSKEKESYYINRLIISMYISILRSDNMKNMNIHKKIIKLKKIYMREKIRKLYIVLKAKRALEIKDYNLELK